MSANTKELKELHKKLAQRMNKALDAEEVSPQMLSAITSFLKNNDITVEKETSEAMTALEKTLKEKSARKKYEPSQEVLRSITEGTHLGNVIEGNFK